MSTKQQAKALTYFTIKRAELQDILSESRPVARGGDNEAYGQLLDALEVAYRNYVYALGQLRNTRESK